MNNEIWMRRASSKSAQLTGMLFIYALLLSWVTAPMTVQAQTYNTFYGTNTPVNPTGIDNSGFGYSALAGLSSGQSNTAVGAFALFGHDMENDNTGVGNYALLDGDGSNNTAVGSAAAAGHLGGKGNSNTAVGRQALREITDGSYNTGSGAQSLQNNTSGANNTADGAYALYSNTGGSYNTATGVSALQFNSMGSNNVALGYNAGVNLTGNNNIDIGNAGKASESGKIRIGTAGKQTATFVAGIWNVSEAVASGIKPVYINSNGQLGTTPPASSARFKEAVKPMEKASEGILSLRPVTFQYKGDEEATPQFGLIAEEVAKVNPDLIIRDEKGEIYTVRYEAVNAMLLNEFLKEHRTVQELKDLAKRQQTSIDQQQKQIEALTAAVQKVSDKVALQQATTHSSITAQ